MSQTHLHVKGPSFTAAAAKSLQSCPTLCDPRHGSPPGFPIPEILQARTLEWVAISLSNAWKWKVKVKSLSHVWLLATSWTAAYQAPPSMGFSRQEYWSGLPLPSPHLSLDCLIHSFVRLIDYLDLFCSLSPTYVCDWVRGAIYLQVYHPALSTTLNELPSYNTQCASLVAQLVKSLPAMQETQIWFLGLEDPLEERMATHFSILAWRNP